MTALSLYELNALVRGILEASTEDSYWVTGELSDAKVGYGGHFYGELIQKDESGQAIVARARVNCWARQYGLLRFRFQQETGEELRTGLQVKLQVRVTFHEQYGYALNILDADTTFTLGDMARKRREILAQLEADGILHDNQDLPLPRLMNRIAIVSSEHAAGYGDFCHQLLSNDYGLYFHTRLFPAVMQGQHVQESIIAALDSILATCEEGKEMYDCVVIIRGGGASGDLSDFDSYPLAASIAQFPLPVITGIGHERDETVLDYVAHTRVKTPTAAAAFLIDHQAQEAARLDDLHQRLLHKASERLQSEHQRLQRHVVVFPLVFQNFRQRQENQLTALAQHLTASLAQTIQCERHRLELMEQRLQSVDPKVLLQRGYSITLCGGKVIRNTDNVPEGAELTTILERGKLTSKVTKRVP